MIELDKRIIKGKRPLTALDTDVAKEFIGKQCYFADNIEDFSNLDNTNVLKGFLTDIDDNEMISGCFKSNGIRSSFFGHFIVPCEWLKEEELAPKHIDFEAAKKDSNFELCEMYGNELLFDTKNNIFYTSDGNVHTYLTVLAQRHYNEEQTKEVMIEKKYRPYTIKDFEKAFLNGEFEDFIIFRDKHEPDDIYTMRYNGNFVRGKFEYICLGAKNFSFESLFENYEVADYDGDWQPFGILEE